MTSGRSWNCYRNEGHNVAKENNYDDYRANNENIATSKYFEYKTKIMAAHQLTIVD